MEELPRGKRPKATVPLPCMVLGYEREVIDTERLRHFAAEGGPNLCDIRGVSNLSTVLDQLSAHTMADRSSDSIRIQKTKPWSGVYLRGVSTSLNQR